MVDCNDNNNNCFCPKLKLNLFKTNQKKKMVWYFTQSIIKTKNLFSKNMLTNRKTHHITHKTPKKRRKKIVLTFFWFFFLNFALKFITYLQTIKILNNNYI